MPFEPAPQVVVNPWIADHPKEARALADLSAYLRVVPIERWDYHSVGCGSLGCALGHAPLVASCAALGLSYAGMIGGPKFEGSLPAELAFRLPENVSEAFFFGGDNVIENCPTYGVFMDDVTPTMVADRIDHWLATGELR